MTHKIAEEIATAIRTAAIQLGDGGEKRVTLACYAFFLTWGSSINEKAEKERLPRALKELLKELQTK